MMKILNLIKNRLKDNHWIVIYNSMESNKKWMVIINNKKRYRWRVVILIHTAHIVYMIVFVYN